MTDKNGDQSGSNPVGKINGKRVKALMESAVSEWRSIEASVTAQCERLEQVSNDLQDRFAWRVMLRSVAWFLLALGYGICIGHYWIH